MVYFKKTYFRRKSADEHKNMNNSLACKYISTGRLQNNVSFNNSEIFSYEKMHKTLLILLLILKYFISNWHRVQSNLGGWF